MCDNTILGSPSEKSSPFHEGNPEKIMTNPRGYCRSPDIELGSPRVFVSVQLFPGISGWEGWEDRH
jgi:hypothetical protein